MRRWLLSWQLYLVFGLFLLGSFGRPSLGNVSLDFNRFYQIIYSQHGEQRARLAVTWQKMLERVKNLPDRQKLTEVNNFVNKVVYYQSDISNNRVKDHWASIAETFGKGAGDCEDYAIAKYITLRLAGVADRNLRLIYVKAFYGGRTQAHLVLGYYPTPNAIPLILDNLIGEVKLANTRRDLRPVFSFNSRGLWAGLSKATKSNPMARLSRWQQVVSKMEREGISLR